MGEIWKEIPETDGRYFVSNKGRVASKLKKPRANEPIDNEVPKGCQIISQQKDKYGYLSAKMYLNGRRKSYLVHRLVMLAFSGKSDLQVNHINEIKTDNRLENLEYVTNKQNSRYSFQKQVERYELESGEVRARYSSITAAGEDGYNIGDIVSACKGKYRQHGGYGWRYCN